MQVPNLELTHKKRITVWRFDIAYALHTVFENSCYVYNSTVVYCTGKSCLFRNQRALQVDISEKSVYKTKCDIITHEPQASMYVNKYFPWVTVH